MIKVVKIKPEEEYDRLAKVYLKINQTIDSISSLGVFPALSWVWCWDVVRQKLESYKAPSGEDYVTNDEFTQEDVWWMFVDEADKNDFSLEYGDEELDDAIFEWMIEKDILVVQDDDAWLDDETLTLDGPWESMDPK